MPKTIFKTDQGNNFGKWQDKTSKYIYFDSIQEILSLITVPKIVADYGGANGILKEFIPQAISIDIDKSKKPDLIDNILTHVGNYDLIVIRFVLHYLNDYEVLQLFKHLKTFHNGQILVIQFTNENLKSKYFNSKNEFKYFRTKSQLKKLLPQHKIIYSRKYKCSIDFYKNRLNIENAKPHVETINAYII